MDTPDPPEPVRPPERHYLELMELMEGFILEMQQMEFYEAKAASDGRSRHDGM